MATYNYPFPSLSWQYQGIDFAYISVTQELANQMYADGIRIVGRYLYADRYPNGKGITAQEIQYYHNAGISIYFYYEVNANDALGGYQAGYDNGIDCLAECTDLNVPQGTMIYCCCDTGVTDVQAQGVVMDYLEGFADALPDYNVGIYGGLNVVSACYDTFPDLYRCEDGTLGPSEFSPINVRQWAIARNNQAKQDGYLRIDNITMDTNGFAQWRGYNVDIVSADDLTNMWGGGSPTPPTPPIPTHKELPIWMYLRLL